MNQNDTKTEPAGARTQPEKCPNCNRILHFYDGCLGYEAMRCRNCGYERDLNAAANAKATAEREARGKPRKRNYKGVWDERTQTWIEPSGTVKQGRRPMFQPFKKDKWALIEACEMGSESGAAEVLKYLKQRDELLEALRDLRAAALRNGFESEMANRAIAAAEKRAQ